MAIYKLNQHSTESEPSSVTLDEGNGAFSCIPFDPDNTCYQIYLKWVAEGNTADPADLADVPSDWDLVREKRDRLLKDSDWAMTTGATIDQAQWSAYREKLRDIPQTYKDKETSEIVWPTIPSSKGPNS